MLREGESIARNGIIATNLVQSGASAYIDRSSVTTTSGNVVVRADNASEIDARVKALTSTGWRLRDSRRCYAVYGTFGD